MVPVCFKTMKKHPEYGLDIDNQVIAALVTYPHIKSLRILLDS